jgi:transcriptional regulator with XRE-family HTH domain
VKSKTDNTLELLSQLSADLPQDVLMSTSMKGIIAAEISMKRQKRGLSQTQFAKLMGVTQSLVSKWENGETNFTLDTLCRIAAKLDIPMQCPFVTKAPRPHYQSVGNVIQISSPNSWRTSSYTPGVYDNIEAEEM